MIKKLEKFLKENKIQYQEIGHKTVYTAHDKAATLRLPEKTIGKTLLIKADKDLVLVLIPGNKNFDKGKFKKIVNDWRKKTNQKPVNPVRKGKVFTGILPRAGFSNGVKNIDFASETLMKNNLKGVKVGAVPPFGKLWKLPVFVDRSLLKEKEIILNSGNYNSSLKIKQKEFKKFDFIQGIFSKPR